MLSRLDRWRPLYHSWYWLVHLAWFAWFSRHSGSSVRQPRCVYSDCRPVLRKNWIHCSICLLKHNRWTLWHDRTMLTVLGILTHLIGETLRWIRLAFRSTQSIKAENLVNMNKGMDLVKPDVIVSMFTLRDVLRKEQFARP